jgi:phosphoribosyl 1,2-cyclic phosphodiesterase
MALSFQTLISSSFGNCVTLCSDHTRLVIDCGLGSMKRTRQALSMLHTSLPIDAVLLTHLHSDHISYYPLRVLEEAGFAVYLHEDSLEPLKEKHYNGYGFRHLNLRPHTTKAFEVGDFRIQPFEVVHNPWYATFGYEIYGGDRKVVFATDFCEWGNLVGRFADADFIFVESNHDLELLRQYYNPNSRYHLPNPRTAELLAAATGESKRPPRSVMLGHLSSQRNTPRLAVRETTQLFKERGLAMEFALSAAPLREAGMEIRF